jgi:hypothetical protein
MALINDVMPVYQFHEVHGTTIRATPERVREAIAEVTAVEMPLVARLFNIRGLPARLMGRTTPPFTEPGPLLEQALRSGFTVLAEAPPWELVVGAIGRFWKLAGNAPVPVEGAAGFMAFDRAGFAKAAMDFRIEPAGDGRVRLTTETRIHVPDPMARRKFARYWFVVHPGSALIRMIWLRAIRRRAEREHGATRAVIGTGSFR